MSDPVHDELLGYALGALDESEREELEAQLRVDPRLRRRLALVRKRLQPLAETQPCLDPPRGLAEKTCRSVAACGRAPRRAAYAASGSPAASPWIAASLGDVVAVVGVFLAASVMLLPAVRHARFQAGLVESQHRLGEMRDLLAADERPAVLPASAGTSRLAPGTLVHAGLVNSAGAGSAAVGNRAALRAAVDESGNELPHSKRSP